jgi:hypothetical protein
VPLLTNRLWHIQIATNETQIVAQTIGLPSKLDFYRRELVRSLGLAEYIGWVDEYYSGPIAVLQVIEPTKYSWITQKVSTSHLPQEVTCKLPEPAPKRFTRQLHRERHPIRIEVLISDLPPGVEWQSSEQRVDGWQMRDEFLRLEHSNAALVSFLNRYGEWGQHTTPTLRYREWDEQSDVRGKMEPEIVIPDEIWKVEDKRKPATGGRPHPHDGCHFKM